MLEIFECDDCGRFFHECDEKQICYEDEYGVGDMFSTRTYDSVGCCPHCGGTDIEEIEDGEKLCEALNEWWRWKQEKTKAKTLARIRIEKALEGK